MLLDDSIFIAGHTGLVGSAILSKLQKDNYRNIHYRTHQELDLTYQRNVDDYFAKIKPKYVFIAAGKVGGIIDNDKNPSDFIFTNLSIQNNVIYAAQTVNVKKLIFFGSSCMYPKNCIQPMDESMLLEGRPEPTSIAYAIAKLAGVQACLSVNKKFNKDIFLPLIPNSIYGPNDNFDPISGHVISSLIHKFHAAQKNNLSELLLWGSGQPKREFIYVDDVVDACMFLMKRENNIKLPINIGTGNDITIRELADLISKKLNFSGKIMWDKTKPDGAPRKLLSSSKINKMGWHSKVNLSEGLDKTINWFLNNNTKL